MGADGGKPRHGDDLSRASREVAGLLGVTVIGAVLRSTQGSELRSGVNQAQAFIDGYHTGLWLTIGLLAAGVVLSYLSLRHRPQSGELLAVPGLAEELTVMEREVTPAEGR